MECLVQKTKQLLVSNFAQGKRLERASICGTRFQMRMLLHPPPLYRFWCRSCSRTWMASVRIPPLCRPDYLFCDQVGF